MEQARLRPTLGRSECTEGMCVTALCALTDVVVCVNMLWLCMCFDMLGSYVLSNVVIVHALQHDVTLYVFQHDMMDIFCMWTSL
jgi:hypothetical protein